MIRRPLRDGLFTLAAITLLLASVAFCIWWGGQR